MRQQPTLRGIEIFAERITTTVYGQFLREDKRIIITKWRLSSHNIKIETGRYTTPFTPREERVCSECPLSVEDEHHVVFQCPLYRNVRMKYRDLLLRLKSIPELLNPTNVVDANEVGDLLLGINDVRRELGLCLSDSTWTWDALWLCCGCAVVVLWMCGIMWLIGFCLLRFDVKQ